MDLITSLGAASGAQFPPHRRGWTRHACAGQWRVEYVSPAQAGMDPYRRGFPQHMAGMETQKVSPAQAGMDRHQAEG